MKAIALIVALQLLGAGLAKAETLSPAEAQKHIGQAATVEGVVSEVHHAASGKAIFVDIGGRYPNQQFTAVIFESDFDKFPKVDSLEGKTVDVSGTIKLYHGRPEIILNDLAQIKAK